MTQIVEIEGGLVRTIERYVISEARIQDVMPLIETRVPIETPVLPRNPVRSLSWDESDPTNKTLELLISLDPSVRTLPFSGTLPGIPCRVSLPYTIFHFKVSTGAVQPRGQDWRLDDMRVYFARERITDLNQLVIAALLPNVYEDGRICHGTTGVPANQPLPDRIDQLVNDWYLSTFTDEHVRPRAWPWDQRTYKKWARETTRNVNCWQDWPEWTDTGTHAKFTLQSLFRRPLNRTDPILLTNNIPDLQTNATFGAAEEWFGRLDATQRFRLRAAMNAWTTEQPNEFVEPEPEPEDDDDA